MKVLWICDLVMPEFCIEFNIKRTVNGGWMSGAMHQMKKYPEITLGFCFPIIDEGRRKDGRLDGYPYYSFPAQFEDWECREEMIRRFADILEDFGPDVVHIWGTEYVHSLETFLACKRLGLENKTLVFIQGLVSVCAHHYLCGIPHYVAVRKSGGQGSMEDDVRLFKEKGRNEITLLKEAREIAGRTEWDKALTFLINKNATYHYMSEVLRPVFYERSGEWHIENMTRHTIFISQASYPVKGFQCMLHALNILKERYSDIQVRVSGWNILEYDTSGSLCPYGDYINELIKKYDLQENVLFLGLLDETRMTDEYLHANVCVSCSTIENSSNSICEALLIGVPVVASYVGGTFDLVEHDRSGYLFDFNAPYMLAYYICQLFENDDICNRFSQNGHESISKRIGKDAVSEEMMKVYYLLADRNREKCSLP